MTISSTSQLCVQWEIPYSHKDYSVDGYQVQIVNTSNGALIEMAELQSNETSFALLLDEAVQYCQFLTVNVTALSSLGRSSPGSVSIGFPIGMQS